MKRLLALILAAALVLALCVTASAKTLESAKAENIFFYATDANGKSVLLKVISLADLKAIAHGQADGRNYYISSTDNYPTTQYCEARGVTIPELVDFVKSKTTVVGADKLGFAGNDTIRLMATDSYGNYNRSWTYSELYSVKRYYFEGLFNSWKVAWEIAGDDNSKFGLSLEDYNEKYKDTDPNYDAKREVFDSGVVTVPILATESFSGRTTSDTLVQSTEIGIADYIAKNGGKVAGSLKGVLSDATALRLALPMTEADLMAAHRTAFDNFKWTYNLLLTSSAGQAAIKSLGTVTEPIASVTLSGDTLIISLSCETSGATIYYSEDGAPQIPYTKSIIVNVAGRDLTKEPFTFYTTAVKEGYDDAGIITAKYPGLAPSFKTLYSGMANAPLTFAAQDSVSASDWKLWTSALTLITLKTPAINGYVKIDTAKYAIDNNVKTITFDASLFPDTGSYSFIFHAAKFADKSTSLTLKKATPTVIPASNLTIGNDLVFTFNDSDYQTGLTLYVTPSNGDSVMISTSFLDRTQSGKVTLKAAYFDSPGCAIFNAGTYKFSFVNSRYEPGTVELDNVQLTIDNLDTFTDLTPGEWYYDAVNYVLTNGLIDAKTAQTFGKSEPTTRGELVIALYRLEDSPEVDNSAEFSDVPQNTELANAVAWASANKVVAGNGNGTFTPNANITREMIAVMFQNYAKYKGFEYPAVGDLSAFTDANDTADWARSGLSWAVAQKIFVGNGNGTITPKATTTRAMVAQILYNWSVNK
jgi:hypothetical protein